MGITYVGIGKMAVSKTPGDLIKTMALGSCVGVMLYDPKIKAAGLLHIALPDSKVAKNKGQNRPCRYADTGIPLLLRGMSKLGCGRGRSLIVKIAGGANVLDPYDTFNIGKRNTLAIKKILWKNSLILKAEDVGGSISRTATIEVNTGRIILSSPGRSTKEL